MAVIVTKLEGELIPEDLRTEQLEQVFKVTDDEGNAHYVESDEEAAKLAVDLSEQSRNSS
ncbi:hypothetical protein [Pseudomonas sp. LS-2]|jgi:hypothetical protein|uniref:hypothetical protein n=1 Tax=Pseudomonas sp. LS-2 TaxID=2315859 RepID=UPI000E75E103|nr:hypothetical protein [Pseudomonas sp. LS-2]RJX74956.1 hypothetical protein D3M70_26645 [Pseudomonas sp. LS-2]